MRRHVDVALRPGLAPVQGVALVVDVLRASTSLVTLVERGCAAIHLAFSVAAARRAAARDPRPLLVGEEGGLPPPDFDYGNSPVELAAAPLGGREVIFATTNGAPALHAAATADAVLVACLRNARAAAHAAWEASREAGIVVLCAGRAENPGGFGIDDLYTAGVLVQRLSDLGDLQLTDGAQAARLLAAAEPDPLRLLRRSAAGQSLLRLGLEQDVIYAAAVDRSAVVPCLGRDLLLLPAL
ncbi:MAG: 2-phosphosulfolactate phosphatase [Armatimonadota bacterium]|nr:2-phosphosulfolactate phosphatase [Armatimonadota bacterium]MDR7474204.1 2-phosphosulfolactate phosphatase [Armatimonadota bacterium]MDR7539308.1 2-phosphosulfolactate phosphatase [Armatimonadota bacterium]